MFFFFFFFFLAFLVITAREVSLVLWTELFAELALGWHGKCWRGCAFVLEKFLCFYQDFIVIYSDARVSSNLETETF